MYLISILLAIVNVAFCLTQVLYAKKKMNFSLFSWTFLSYFSVLLLVAVLRKSDFYEGYSGQYVTYSDMDYLNVTGFVLVANLMFALGYLIVSKIRILRLSIADQWLSEFKMAKENPFGKILLPIYGVYFLLGVILYAVTSMGMSYSEFVEYQGSNWGIVFLYASSPIICILWMRGNYVPAILASSVFVYFSINLQVRSFFIFSLFPIIFIYFFSNIKASNSFFVWLKKPAGIFSILSVLGLSLFIIFQKTGRFGLPEGTLVDSMIQVMHKLDSGAPGTGWDSTERFLYGFISPVLGFLNITPELNEDVQVYFASLIFGFSRADVYYHYPSLWYSDAYSSFGWLGIFFGLFWGGLFYVLEKIIRKNKVIFCLFLPFYIWIVYMVMRGAIGNSAAAISYPVYIGALSYIFVVMVIYLASGSGAKLQKLKNK